MRRRLKEEEGECEKGIDMGIKQGSGEGRDKELERVSIQHRRGDIELRRELREGRPYLRIGNSEGK